jgi:D-ribulokinase
LPGSAWKSTWTASSASYLAGVYGLGYRVRQIVQSLYEKRVPIDTIVVSGGAGQSPLVRQLLADATGIVVAASTSQELVLLGWAILGAVAAGHHKDMVAATAAMSEVGELYRPAAASADWHARRFVAFELLQRASRAIRRLD